MAWLCKRGSRRNYYVALWLPHQKRKMFISTKTTILDKAEKILKQVQLAEDIRKTHMKALKLLYQDAQFEQGLLDDLSDLQDVDNSLSLEVAVERFLKSRINEIAVSTLKSYKLALRDLTRALKPSLQVIHLRRSDYDRILAYLVGRYNNSTINIRLRGIRTFLNWLVEYGYLTKVPFKVKQLKIDKLPRFLKPNEIAAIYRYVSDPVIASAFKVYQFCGLRLSELFSSTLDGKYLKVLGKGEKYRFVPITAEIINDYLVTQATKYSIHTITKAFTRAWRLTLLETHPTFVDVDNIRELSDRRLKEIVFEILEWEYAKTLGKTELNEAEKRESHSRVMTLHSLRHTFAVRTWMQNGDIYAVKKLLGHSSISTTENYAKFPEEYLKVIFEK